jgi:hypothetical protein
VAGMACVLDIASWLKRLASAEEVRPAHCPACGAASTSGLCTRAEVAIIEYPARIRIKQLAP